MATKATAPVLDSVGSHSVSLEFDRHVSREECYPVLLATWRGERIRVTMEANRYVHSEGWSEWRIFGYRTEPGTTDLARSALVDACRPLVEEWLASYSYTVSRQEAFRWMIRRLIRDENVLADRPSRVLEEYGHELTDEDREDLTEAVECLRRLFALLDGSARVTA